MPDWRLIKGYYYPYRINEDGKVEVQRNNKWYPVSPYVWRRKDCMYGDLMIHMRRADGGRTHKRVKHLMAQAFYGKSGPGVMVSLKNGAITDCSLTNIEFTDRKKAAERAGRASFRTSIEKVDRDGNVVALYSSMAEAARENFVSRKSIWMRCKGKVKNPYDLDGYDYRYECKKKKGPKKHV